MTITALPTPPNRQDPSTFEDRADAFLGALPQFGEEANALAAGLNSIESNSSASASAAKLSETNAKTSELNSLANAQNAAASNNAPKWISGITYNEGRIAWSPLNGRIYKRLITGAGTTDPSNDSTNWVLLSIVVEQSDIGSAPNQVPLNQYLGNLAFMDSEAVQISGGVVTAQIRRRAPVTKTTSFTVSDTEHWIICNGTAAINVTLPDAATNTGRELMIKTIAAFAVNSKYTNVVPLTGTAAGTSILTNTAGKWATLVSDGTNWIVMQAN